ncbi:hypothetical protein FQN57_003206 [Myotisia sp. PD_48]|nr:hypothetical protein FQN57_003206 [Myotisia sp. PD_48]
MGEESNEQASLESTQKMDKNIEQVNIESTQKIDKELKVKAPKKTKKKSSKKKNKPTGFEEYYVDRPITPAEYEQEKFIYDKAKPAVQRLESCIQRYQAKRRMHEDRREVFVKYLSYGGVEVGPKMFEGNDQRDLKNLDAEDIVTATAESSIPANREDWDVDFEKVAKGFFSSELPQFYCLDTEDKVMMATGTIKNFLNYVIYHNVCPEYTESIMAARRVCDEASKELWQMQQVVAAAPGDFNKACSTLFGGVQFEAYEDDQSWDGKEDNVCMSLPTARKVVKFALAGAGTLDQAVKFRDLANSNGLKATLVHEDGFEVIGVVMTSAETKTFFHSQGQNLKAVGKLIAIPWRDPSIPDEDLPPGKTPRYRHFLHEENGDGKDKPREVPSEVFEFLVEDEILQHLILGMKIDAQVWELNCGLHYFNRLVGVYSSFYTVLPNDSMRGWKKPRDLRGDHIVCTPSHEGENRSEGGDSD